jgi:hypothetical protein
MREIIIIDDGPHAINAEAWASLKARTDADNRVVILDHKTQGDLEMGSLNKSVVISALAAGLAGLAQQPVFSAAFPSPPVRNGGRKSGVAQAKRAKARRVNVGKRNRTAHKGGRHG